MRGLGRAGEPRIRLSILMWTFHSESGSNDFFLAVLGHLAWRQRKSTVRQIWKRGPPAIPQTVEDVKESNTQLTEWSRLVLGGSGASSLRKFRGPNRRFCGSKRMRTLFSRFPLTHLVRGLKVPYLLQQLLLIENQSRERTHYFKIPLALSLKTQIV